MKKIAIFGAGGFGREVACLINKINEENTQSNQWQLIGFFDDVQPIGYKNEYGEVLGGLKDLNKWDEELSIAIAIGNSLIVRKIVEKINNPNILFPNLSYNLYTADPNNIKIGKGNIMTRGCSLSCNVSIGDFNVFNSQVVLGHDVVIGDFNTIMPGVRISGNVEIKNNNFLGVGSIVLQKLKIGEFVKLGAGSVLMTNPKDKNLYIGNPAKIFRY